MVQHITIKPNTAGTDPEPDPKVAKLWRDDQTLKWGLAEGYSWPNPDGVQSVPIKFLAAVDGYAEWPGSAPTAIGPRPDPGTPDRRFYVATSDEVLDPGQTLVVQKYHYAFVVCGVDDPGCPVTIDAMALLEPDQQQWKRPGGLGVWHDPEVENRNQP